jgi:hypothetical protein
MSGMAKRAVARRTVLVGAALLPLIRCGSAGADPSALVLVESFRDNQRSDHQILEAAFTAATPGSEIRLGSGVTYRVNQPLEFDLSSKPNVVINGQGAVIAAPRLAGTVLQIRGQKTKTATTLTGAVAQGTRTLTVESTVGFVAGDVVSIVSSSELFNPERDYYFKQEMARIASVLDARSLVLEGPAWNSYSVAGHTVTVTRYKPVRNLTIKNLQITGANDGVAYQIGLKVRYFDGLKITELDVGGLPFQGVVAETGINCLILNSRAFDCNARGHGYGFFVQETNIARIIDCYGARNRHSFDSDFSRDVLYSGCTAEEDKSSGISIHGNSDTAEILNCTVKYCGGGISARGSNTSIRGNRIIGSRPLVDSDESYKHGILLGPHSPSDQISGVSGTNLVVEQNIVDLSGTDLSADGIHGFYGIYCATPLTNAAIANNNLSGFSSHGIYCQGDTNAGVRIYGNRLDCSYQLSSNNSFAMGVFIAPSQAMDVSNPQTDIDVSNNVITGALGSGIRISGGSAAGAASDRIRILSNRIGSCGTSPIYLGPGYFGPDVSVYGNETEDDPVTLLTGTFSQPPQLQP